MLILILTTTWSCFAQPIYNNCNNAVDICPDRWMTFTNVDANATLCNNCEDDFNFCFTPNNTIWLKFTTNSVGGTVQVNFSNLVFESAVGQSQQLQATLIQATTPCDASTYIQLGNCVSNASGNFSLTIPAVNPNSTYYIVVGGDQTGTGISIAAECTFDAYLTGGAVSRTSPFISIQPSSNAICKNDIVTFNVVIANCPDSTNFKWFLNGQFVASTAEAFYQTASLNDGDIVSVQTTCYQICVDTISKTSIPIQVTSLIADAGPDIYKDPTKVKNLEGTLTGAIHYWTPNLYLSDTSALTPFCETPTTMSYILTVKENGCTAYDEMTVYVNENLIIPSTFSPNGDGKNETFEILYIEKYKDNKLQIFDRWGQKVFETIGYDYEKAWDGKDRSGDFAEGVYYYHLELNDVDHQVFNGSITVIK
ncbi:MAG: gliding motility-associated C-terminal domain-containing protein [Flavobacteriia bacterium]|nr:gliding motility-associated C-terminal domain-containing protein [Flavobacteriia bacterium]